MNVCNSEFGSSGNNGHEKEKKNLNEIISSAVDYLEEMAGKSGFFLEPTLKLLNPLLGEPDGWRVIMESEKMRGPGGPLGVFGFELELKGDLKESEEYISKTIFNAIYHLLDMKDNSENSKYSANSIVRLLLSNNVKSSYSI